MKINYEQINRDMEAIRLLEEIIETYQSTEFRPKRSIELYQRYNELKAKENAKIAGPFLVINGGQRRAIQRNHIKPWKRRQFTVISGSRTA